MMRHNQIFITKNMHLIIFTALCLFYHQVTAFSEIDNYELKPTPNILNTNTNATQIREGKISLFSIVRFANTACVGSNSLNGTCLTSAECSTQGGTGYGSCASGFGVCCILAITTCGSTTSLNNTYWQNPGYAAAYTSAGQCSIYVSKTSSSVSQLRLDFVAFTLASPNAVTSTAYGQCLTDVFTVSGASNPVPAICGSNANQHIYIDLSPGTTTAALSIITSGTATSRLWNILIRQIPFGTTWTAPDSCLQWYTESTGTLTSFNYRYATTPVVQHLAYQDYTICIRMNQGFCGICYVACTGTPAAAAFLISGAAAATAAVTATSLVDTSCWTDWVQIPCATDLMNSVVLSSSAVGAVVPCVNKLCGAYFNVLTATGSSAPVYSYRKPFELRFYTDSTETIITTTGEGIGFCLSYTQQPCTFTSSSG